MLAELTGVALADMQEMACLIGGGAGLKALSLSLAGVKDVYFLDVSEETIGQIQAANQTLQHPITVIHGSLMDEQPDLRERFDLVWCLGVLHHTEFPSRGLQVIHQMLKAGGLLSVNFYYSGSLLFFWVSALRQLIAASSINYIELNELILKSGYADSLVSFSRRVILDHLFTLVIHPADPNMVRRDFKRIGYTIIRDDRGGGLPDLNSEKPRMEFLLKKTRDNAVDPELLEYKRGIDQLMLYDGEDIILFLLRLNNATDRLRQTGLTAETGELLIRLLNVSYRAGCYTNIRRRLGGLKNEGDPRFLFSRDTPRSYFLRETGKLLEAMAS